MYQSQRGCKSYVSAETSMSLPLNKFSSFFSRSEIILQIFWNYENLDVSRLSKAHFSNFDWEFHLVHIRGSLDHRNGYHS